MMESAGELVIEAGRTERHYWKDLWRYRELFYFLAWRDILVVFMWNLFRMVGEGISASGVSSAQAAHAMPGRGCR